MQGHRARRRSTSPRCPAVSLSSGMSFQELVKRPNITPDDAEAIERNAPSIRGRRHHARRRWPGPAANGADLLRNQRTKQMHGHGHHRSLALRRQSSDGHSGRFFTTGEVQRRTRVVVLGQTPAEALFPNVDPLGKTVRVGFEEYDGHRRAWQSVRARRLQHRRGRLRRRAVHDLCQAVRHPPEHRRAAAQFRSAMIAAVPRDGVSREQAMREVEEVMRIRHGLRLDEPNDFDLITQDAILASVESDQPGRRSWRWSCCRRSRSWWAASAS